MSNLSVIIPVHEYTTDVEKLLPTAVNSAAFMDYDIDIMVVGPAAVLKEIKKILKGVAVPLSYVANEVSDYCSQVNAAVEKVVAPYFTVLEFDDQFTTNWAKNVDKYMSATFNLGDKVSVFMPLTQTFDFKKDDNNFVGFLNEVGWARGFADDDLGFITFDALMAYYDYNMSGAVIKTDVFQKLGGLKPSIKLFFWYEFLLRATHNGEKLFVVPKIGYQHFVNRDGSLTKNYEVELTRDEAEWWLKTAQSECFYKNDRNKTYEA